MGTRFHFVGRGGDGAGSISLSTSNPTESNAAK